MVSGMTALEEWLAFAIAILAGAIATASGFGIGSLLTPFLMLSSPTADAVTIVAVPHAVANAVRLARLRADVHGPTFHQFGLASAAGGLGGALLQGRLASPILTVILAVLLILAGTTELAGRRVPLPRTPTWRLAGGLLSGLFGGLVGNQGGIRAAALLGFELPPRQLVATATASALIVDAARVPVYLAAASDVMSAHLGAIAWLTVGVTVGTLAGVPLLGRIPGPTYRRLVGGLLLVLGAALLLSTRR